MQIPQVLFQVKEALVGKVAAAAADMPDQLQRDPVPPPVGTLR
jgi:hypothetical protein